MRRKSMKRIGKIFLLAMLLGVLSGCATPPNAVNFATADALDYKHLTRGKGKQSKELAEAVGKVSQSYEHQRMQYVLADLPADMRHCLVVEVADIDAKGIELSFVSLFSTEESAGFLSNFDFDEDGGQGQPGGGWRVAVWDAPEKLDAMFEVNPVDLLAVADPSTQASTRTVVIVTLANEKQVVCVAGFAEDHPAGRGRERLMRHLIQSAKKTDRAL